MKMKLLLTSLGIAGLFLFGCSTPEKVATLEGKGQAKIYNTSYQETWKAAVDSAWGLGLTVLRVYPKEGLISTKRGMTSTTFGEDVAIWVKEAGPGKTQVEVVCRQKGVPVIKQKHWEADVFHAIEDRLNPASVAQGGAPGDSIPIRSSGASGPRRTTTEAPLELQPAAAIAVVPQSQASPTPAAKASHPKVAESQADFNLTKDMILREQLRRYLAAKESELKTEKEPARKQLIQGEMDYLREEFNRLDAKLSNVPK
jgi:hypothetical protein